MEGRFDGRQAAGRRTGQERRSGQRRPPEGQALLDEVMAFLARYVVMTDAQRLVIALWIVHTHLVQHVEQTPYLSITSPDPECGKSRLLEVLNQLVARPWMTVRPSEAVAYPADRRQDADAAAR